jgi:hypothetical protein
MAAGAGREEAAHLRQERSREPPKKGSKTIYASKAGPFLQPGPTFHSFHYLLIAHSFLIH